MKVAITVSSLSELTTNQLVGISVAEELERRGHSVDFYCVGETSIERINTRFHKSLASRVFSTRWFWAPGSTIYDYPILSAILRVPGNYDVVYEAIGPVVHLSSAQMAQVTYVFFPPHPDLMGGGKFRKGAWRLYSVPYRLFYRSFAPNVRMTRLLTISGYVRDLCKTAWGMDSDVVFFPVPYQEWEQGSQATRREGIITIGRFSPEKKHSDQLEIAEGLARHGIKTPIQIVGAVSSSLSAKLYSGLKSEASRRNLGNIHFHPNLPKKEVIALAQRSKVFLHTMHYEHFGIVTVEAIAAGCVPLVHDSGGSREIVPFEELRFRNLEEAAEKARLALSGEFDGYLPELKQHIARFSEDRFKARVAEAVLSEARKRPDSA